MRHASDGPGAGPGQEPVAQTGRPPVPRRVPEGTQDDVPVGEQRTERVPFPLPPLPSAGSTGSSAASAGAPAGSTGAPSPVPGPETGQLRIGGYPPRVPGRPRGRAGTEGAPAAEDRAGTPGLGTDRGGGTGGANGG